MNKNYFSIPHLPGSLNKENDEYLDERFVKLCTEKLENENQIVIIQEKLDGTNVCVKMYYPKDKNASDDQKKWIARYMADFESTLSGPAFADPGEVASAGLR